MFSFVLGFVVGAVAAVAIPWVYAKAGELYTKLKDAV